MKKFCVWGIGILSAVVLAGCAGKTAKTEEEMSETTEAAVTTEENMQEEDSTEEAETADKDESDENGGEADNVEEAGENEAEDTAIVDPQEFPRQLVRGNKEIIGFNIPEGWKIEWTGSMDDDEDANGSYYNWLELSSTETESGESIFIGYIEGYDYSYDDLSINENNEVSVNQDRFEMASGTEITDMNFNEMESIDTIYGEWSIYYLTFSWENNYKIAREYIVIPVGDENVEIMYDYGFSKDSAEYQGKLKEILPEILELK